ncbi:MAG: hypothetical protein SCM11_18490 [Bacillota bacterium]|nr:hypothetical protein [Bacillota bacterium]
MTISTEKHRASAGTGSKMAASHTAIRKRFPLPHELLEPTDAEERDRLAIIIETTPVGRPIIDLAHQLTSRDLRLIFPLLAEPLRPDARSEHYHDKLYLIIRERACHSLYRYGWAIFQQTFPYVPVARGLATLCSILEIKLTSAAMQTPAAKPTQVELNWQPPLISYLAQPDSRHFADQLLKAMGKLKLPLERFMKQYEIDPELPLGGTLVGQCFISGDAGLFTGSHLQFQQALAHAGSDIQVTLIKRLFSMNDLEADTANRYFQVVYRLFGEPAGGHPIWSLLRKKDAVTFQKWITAATIGSHCRKSKAKARFYLRYAELVQEIERWDDTTIILHFPGFIIVDERQQPLFSLYYEQDNPEVLPFDFRQASGDQNPGSTVVPHRRVEDAVSRASTDGPVGLLFDEEGMRISAAFIDYCLCQKKAISRNKLKNLEPL